MDVNDPFWTTLDNIMLGILIGCGVAAVVCMFVLLGLSFWLLVS